MYRSAARGLGLCALRLPMHCPDSDPTHAKRGAGMWNLTSLRAARACRKLGRVAERLARQVHRIGLGRTERHEAQATACSSACAETHARMASTKT